MDTSNRTYLIWVKNDTPILLHSVFNTFFGRHGTSNDMSVEERKNPAKSRLTKIRD